MKRSVKLYNVLLPIWILYFFPQVWLITLPGNLLIDCLVLLLTLAALKHTGKRAVLKKLWWKFWLLGFLADFIGAALLFGVWYLSLLPEPVGPWVEGIIYDAFVNPFRSLPALLYTLAGVRWRACASTSSTKGPCAPAPSWTGGSDTSSPWPWLSPPHPGRF